MTLLDPPAPTRLETLLARSPYEAYTYAYPHKTAYRPLRPAVPLATAWAEENRDALFLYLHVPFCEMRCGFCNLFTQTHPGENLLRDYLDALHRQARVTRAALGPDARFARLAFGGGTPTFLDEDGLRTLFEVAVDVMGAEPGTVPFSVESSPATATAGKLALLRAGGVDRLSLGVQSFVETETRAVGRAQTRVEAEAALGRAREAGFPTLNVDLIYGLPGQTVGSWLQSLEGALAFRPEELFLYPLYVRPLTGLGRRGGEAWEDGRPELYREAVARLEAAGYTQVSMRMFRAAHAPSLDDAPAYCAQEDGLVGLGCGARSYTRELQYASEYAVGARGVREIIRDYAKRSEAAFAAADFGFRLDALGIRYSVGVVGLREHLGEIEALRTELPVGVYLWVNAFKRVPGGYSENELARLEAVDPLFRLNTQPHPSLGKSCRGGAEVISVDGDGTMRRCHFIRTPIGNLYEPGWERALRKRPCANATCGCHIGYVHLDELDLRAVFGAGLLERIPSEPIWQRVLTA